MRLDQIVRKKKKNLRSELALKKKENQPAKPGTLKAMSDGEGDSQHDMLSGAWQ